VTQGDGYCDSQCEAGYSLVSDNTYAPSDTNYTCASRSHFYITVSNIMAPDNIFAYIRVGQTYAV